MNGKTPTTILAGSIAGLQDLHPAASAYTASLQVFTTGVDVTNAPDDGGDYRYSIGLMVRRNATQYGVIILNRNGGIRSTWYTNEVWRPWG